MAAHVVPPVPLTGHNATIGKAKGRIARQENERGMRYCIDMSALLHPRLASRSQPSFLVFEHSCHSLPTLLVSCSHHHAHLFFGSQHISSCISISGICWLPPAPHKPQEPSYTLRQLRRTLNKLVQLQRPHRQRPMSRARCSIASCRSTWRRQPTRMLLQTVRPPPILFKDHEKLT
jgi:hypothetical protein